MTREEFYNIQSAVERIRERAIAKHQFSHNDYDSGIANGCLEVLDFLAGIEDSLPSEPQGLDEAAEEALPEKPRLIIYSDGYSDKTESGYDKKQAIAMFKAGAKWMSGQGWSRELEVKEDAGGYPYIDKHIELYDYDTDTPFAKKGDKVIVQIRKI